MSRTSRALVTRSKLEMDVRLGNVGRMLGSILSEDLSEAHLGLTPGARSHLDKFRSFLQSYYVAKLGYYPPSGGAFPKNIYGQMCTEFQKLYDLLVDTQFSTADDIPTAQQGGICVFQNIQAFDARHKYPSLTHPLPLLPEVDDSASLSKPPLNKRFSFRGKADKMKPDARLVAISSMNKATNRKDQSLYDCSLVRAYRGFENECVFSTSKADKNEKLSQTDARKVRWILVYSILQTLLSVTRVPEEVRDTLNVPYSLCVLTGGCPPWKDERPLESLLRTQTKQTKDDFIATLSKPASMNESTSYAPGQIKPDVDYFALLHKAQPSQPSSISASPATTSRANTVRRALSSLGNMPELRHPKPKCGASHEILIQGYGNGTNSVSITAEPTFPKEHDDHQRPASIDSSSASTEDLSSGWSNSSSGDAGDSPHTSIAASRRGSDVSVNHNKKSIKEFLDAPMTTMGLTRMPRSVSSPSVYENASILKPDPLAVKKNDEEFMKVTTEVKVEWEDANGKANPEVLAYIEGE